VTTYVVPRKGRRGNKSVIPNKGHPAPSTTSWGWAGGNLDCFRRAQSKRGLASAALQRRNCRRADLQAIGYRRNTRSDTSKPGGQRHVTRDQTRTTANARPSHFFKGPSHLKKRVGARMRLALATAPAFQTGEAELRRWKNLPVGRAAILKRVAGHLDDREIVTV